MVGNDKKYQEILESGAQEIAVIAGPGSGKTKGVLIPKAQALLNGAVDSEDILLLTFSRASAQDLKGRFHHIGDTPIISTLHSYCLSFLLSENNHDIRNRIESIILEFEKAVILSDLKNRMHHLHKREIHKMLKEFSAGWSTKPIEEVFEESDQQREFKYSLIQWLQEHEAAMMEEIVYSAVDLAKKINSPYISSPEYILVDEYQDLNKLEQEFIDLLGRNSQLVLVVGDPDQSIYSFKYAYPEGINSFAERDTVEHHTLEYTGRCPKTVVGFANKLLQQDDPQRSVLLKPLEDKEEGSVLVKRFNKQDEEFDYVMTDIQSKLSTGISASDILVLVPKKKLGKAFVDYVSDKDEQFSKRFFLTTKTGFTSAEQEKITLLSLLINPKSLLRIRVYAGMGDKTHFSKEVEMVKLKYGSLLDALHKANPDDFPKRNKRVRTLCSRLSELNDYLVLHSEEESAENLIDLLFPEGSSELNETRKILLDLLDEDDTPRQLFQKFIDYSRSIKADDDQIPVMTLLSSKGLDASHVYMLSCNAGNIPGNNRSSHLTDFQFKQEQRRLLFVGATRAKSSLTITWSQLVPFEQAMRSKTQNLGIRTIGGVKYCRVGICEYLQDL